MKNQQKVLQGSTVPQQREGIAGSEWQSPDRKLREGQTSSGSENNTRNTGKEILEEQRKKNNERAKEQRKGWMSCTETLAEELLEEQRKKNEDRKKADALA